MSNPDLEFLKDASAKVAALTDEQGLPEITPESLKALAGFAGKLVKSAAGIEASMDENKTVARMLGDGSLAVKVPLGNQPTVSLDTLREVGGDLSKGLFGYMKTIGLGHFAKVDGLHVRSGASCTHPELKDSAFVIAFSLKP